MSGMLQVVYEYRVALLVGRCLVYPADSVGLAASLRRIIQFRSADGCIADMEVDLVFPGTERSVVRLMQSWWDAKVGQWLALLTACLAVCLDRAAV